MATHSLVEFSDRTAQIVERVAGSIVAVHSGGRWSASGIHWRQGIVVTAEETLERDENITITLPGGRQVSATLVGRDPSTDVAVLRLPPDEQPVAETADATSLRAGHIVLGIGSYEGAAVASLGIVAFVGSAWYSLRGGTIDSFLRLDLALSSVAEGGALVDVHGRVLGMAVFGPRRRVLAIPKSTIDRAVDQLLAKGHVVRGYLGAGLQRVLLAGQPGESRPSASEHGILVVSVDPTGPASGAGLLIGDIITAWDAKPVNRVREVIRLLGPESVGKSVDLQLLRGGVRTARTIVIGERPLA
jgi:S1-C subfamily serine protease